MLLDWRRSAVGWTRLKGFGLVEESTLGELSSRFVKIRSRIDITVHQLNLKTKS